MSSWSKWLFITFSMNYPKSVSPKKNKPVYYSFIIVFPIQLDFKTSSFCNASRIIYKKISPSFGRYNVSAGLWVNGKNYFLYKNANERLLNFFYPTHHFILKLYWVISTVSAITRSCYWKNICLSWKSEMIGKGWDRKRIANG